MRYERISSLFVSALLLAGAHVSGAAPEPPSKKPQTTETKAQETVDLKISGMTWPVNCPKRVRAALEKVPGVINAEVTYPDKAVVKIEKGKTDASKLMAAVKKAGYGASVRDEKKK